MGPKRLEQTIQKIIWKYVIVTKRVNIRRTNFLSRHFISRRYMEVLKTDRKATTTYFARIDFRRARAQVALA